MTGHSDDTGSGTGTVREREDDAVPGSDDATGAKGSDDGQASANEGDRPASGIRAILAALTAAAAGVLVTGGLAAVGAFWPALTVLAGAVTTSGALLARRGGRKRYLLAGVAYCLGLAVAVELGAGTLPTAYTRGVLPAAGGLGALSGLLVIAKAAGKRVVKRLAVLVARDEEYWGQVWEALAAFASLLSLAWLLVTFAEKVIRYAGVTVGAIALLVANLLGYEVTVTLFGVRVEAVMALFVGCVLVWFHLLDTLHNSWRAVALSAERAGARDREADEGASAGAEG